MTYLNIYSSRLAETGLNKTPNPVQDPIIKPFLLRLDHVPPLDGQVLYASLPHLRRQATVNVLLIKQHLAAPEPLGEVSRFHRITVTICLLAGSTRAK